MIRLTAIFTEANKAKTDPGPKIPVGAHGRNFAQRCKQMIDEVQSFLDDMERLKKSDPNYIGNLAAFKSGIDKLTSAQSAFERAK